MTLSGKLFLIGPIRHGRFGFCLLRAFRFHPNTYATPGWKCWEWMWFRVYRFASVDVEEVA